MLSSNSVFITKDSETISNFYCILRIFVNPNIASQVFITIGNSGNAPADQDVMCAFLDVGKSPTSVIFNVSDASGADCPINSGVVYAGWHTDSTIPACPSSSVALPWTLHGVGKLSDPEASKNSHLFLEKSSWTTVSQGSIVTVQCASSITTVKTKTVTVTQIALSNSFKAGAAQEGCVWALALPPSTLRYKFGVKGACPSDFSHPITIPFNFSAARTAASVFEQSRFLISFWVDPIVPAAQFPFEYARIARANFTAVMGGFGATDPTSVAAQVNACLGSGLECIPSSCETAADPGGSDSCIGTGRGNPALLGYQLADEPQEKDFPEIASWLESVASRTDPGTLRFVNLLPNYAYFPSTYEDYLTSFVTTVKPDILCFDHYPLFYPGSETEPSNNATQAGYMRNLASVRAVAQQQGGLAYWNFMNTMPFNGRPDVTEAQIRWQVFTSLVYGAKGVLYFCYWSPTGQSNGFQWGNAILTPRAPPNGSSMVYTEGPHFAQVSRVNTKLLLLGGLLLRAVSTSVLLIQGSNGTLVPTLGGGGNISALGNSIASSPLPFNVLLGVFSGSWGGTLGVGSSRTPASLSQAIVVHNQDVNYPLLLRLDLAAGARALEADTNGVLGEVWNDAPEAPGDLSISLEAGDARVLFF